MGEMCQRMTHSEWCYWMARQGLSLIGDDRADLRAGIIAAEVHNANVTKKKDVKSPTDFMPFYKESKKPGFDKKAFFKNLDKHAVRKP